jgi:hypothetical protein
MAFKGNDIFQCKIVIRFWEKFISQFPLNRTRWGSDYSFSTKGALVNLLMTIYAPRIYTLRAMFKLDGRIATEIAFFVCCFFLMIFSFQMGTFTGALDRFITRITVPHGFNFEGINGHNEIFVEIL